MEKRIEGFKYIAFKDSRVLLLGTLPGRKSLERQFYYADNGNYFWKFFKEYTNTEKIPTNMDEAKYILKKAKVALWDVLESAERVTKSGKRTSMDKDISKGRENDIIKLCQEYPNIEE